MIKIVPLKCSDCIFCRAVIVDKNFDLHKNYNGESWSNSHMHSDQSFLFIFNKCQVLEQKQKHSCYPGGHLNNSFVHMRDQRNVKEGLFKFFEAKCNSCEERLGVKMCLFLRKRVLLDSIKERLGSFYQTPP